MPKHLFLFGFALALSTGCLTPTANTEAHPCETAEHCIYDAARGESLCQEGYTWEDPSDANNFNCVLMDDSGCTPTTCAEQNADCGTLPDGCDGTLS